MTVSVSQVLHHYSHRLYATTAVPSSSAGRFVRASVALVGTGLFALYYFDSRAALHQYILTPLLRNTLDAETAHRVAVRVLGSGIAPRDLGVDDERLKTRVRAFLCVPCYLRLKQEYSYGTVSLIVRWGLRLGLIKTERRLTGCLILASAGSRLGVSRPSHR
jgi:hypothetical protein